MYEFYDFYNLRVFLLVISIYCLYYYTCYIPCVVQARVGTSSYDLIDEAGKPLGIFSAADLKPCTWKEKTVMD